MSYKSLLFCPDDKTAQLLTQVLSELDFTVELAHDPELTAKKLAGEHFDAVVADIQNEQDAALLFKSARDSQLNHGSLSVAVVDGPAGVAKAFRIGANLVLTKPINIEQSKGTLRVARGLLKKNEAKPVSPAAPRSASVPVMPAVPAPPLSAPPATPTANAAPAASSETSFSMLETEKESAPAPEPAEAALIEAMVEATGSKPGSTEQTWAPKLRGSAEPIAASTTSGASSGTAAAVAPALEKPVVEVKSAPPLASQEPLATSEAIRETFEPATVPVPAFSYAQQSSSGGTKWLKTAIMFTLFGVAGYMGYQKFQVGQYLQNLRATSHTTESEPMKPPTPSTAPTKASAPTSTNPTPSPAQTFPDLTLPTSDESNATSTDYSPHEHTNRPETIEVQELASTPEPKVTVTPRPLVVNTKSAPALATPKTNQPAPPALNIAQTGSSEVLSNIVSSTAAPTPSLATLHVSQGVSQGLLMKKVSPVYPLSALQMRKQGTVELTATISKNGSISKIRVLGGDPLFAQAASEAVRQWKYRPYLLNGEPVEIETQITINFRLPH